MQDLSQDNIDKPRFKKWDELEYWEREDEINYDLLSDDVLDELFYTDEKSSSKKLRQILKAQKTGRRNTAAGVASRRQKKKRHQDDTEDFNKWLDSQTSDHDDDV